MGSGLPAEARVSVEFPPGGQNAEKLQWFYRPELKNAENGAAGSGSRRLRKAEIQWNDL